MQVLAKYFLLSSIFAFYSCHFYDDRVRLVNKSSELIHAGVCAQNPKGLKDSFSPFFPIQPGDKEELLLLKDLLYQELAIDSISIVIFSDEVKERVKVDTDRYDFEKIIKDGLFKKYTYTIEDVLDDNELVAIYPDHGFIKP